MFTRRILVSAALLGSIALPVSADLPLGRGEASYLPHPLGPSIVTREQVARERDAWERNPVTPSGWKEVAGEAGWIYVGNDRPLDPRQRTVAVPVPSDGWKYVGGEAGWLYVGSAQRDTIAANVR